MRDSKAIQIVAALVTVGAVAAMVITERGGFAAGVNAAPHRAAGAELARQTLSLLKPGGQITVITRDTTAFQNPASDFLLEGFQRELRRAHASIRDIQKAASGSAPSHRSAVGRFPKLDSSCGGRGRHRFVHGAAAADFGAAASTRRNPARHRGFLSRRLA